MTEELKEVTSDGAITDTPEVRQRVIDLAFGGNPEQLAEFCDVVRKAIPEGTRVVLRGSCVTGERYVDGAPFDADGLGTSDLDLTLVGDKVHALYILDGYYIPKVHSKPLSDKDPDIAPDLIPLRERLQGMVKRPVNIQATRDWVMYVRENLMGQPYLTLIETSEDE
jgi:hypothetical protein